MNRNVIAAHGYRPFSQSGVALQGYRGDQSGGKPLLFFACPPLLTLRVIEVELSLQLVDVAVLLSSLRVIENQLSIQVLDVDTDEAVVNVPALQRRNCNE